MISVTWMIDVDKNTEYLACRNEEDGKEPDVVKVHFQTKFDVRMAKSEGLEMPIAKAIFSNREIYGHILTGWLDVMPHTIFFQTKTDTPIYTEAIVKHRE